MINANALKHPRTAWSIEAALWRAAEHGSAIDCDALYGAGYRLTKGDDK